MEERELSDAEWDEALQTAMIAMRKRAYERRMERASRRTSPWVL